MIKNSIPCASEIDKVLQEAFELRVSDVRKSITIVEETLSQCKSIGYDKGKATSNSHLGLFNMIIGKFNDGLIYSEEALNYFTSIEDKAGMAPAYYNIVSIHYKTANLALGLEFLYKGLSIHQELGDKWGESKTLKAIGYIYDEFGRYDKALETYELCRKISHEIGDKNGESNACNPLSSLYLKNGDYKKALETSDTSIRLKLETGDKRGYAFAIYAKAKVQLIIGEIESSRQLFLECLDEQKLMGEALGTAMCLIKLGKVHYLLEEYDSSKKYLFEAVDFSKALTNKQYVSKASYHLFRVAKAEGDDTLALKYHIAYHQNRKEVIEKDTSDKLKGMEAIWRTETLEREANLQKIKNEEISKKNAELDKFVYRVSHDLRGPISSLIGLYSIVKKKITDKDSMYYFDLYNRQINRLNAIIIALIEMTRVRELQVRKDKIDFMKIVDDCLFSFNCLPNYDKISFDININRNLEFYSDKSLMNTIIQNLIENGIKYSSNEKPYLKIEIVSDGVGNLVIEVSDNGIGIDEQYHEKIFDMFFRASEEVSGTGLGMYILSDAVDKLHGKIVVESELGKGSNFKIVIPIK
jgi:signal transduction histidine kinase